MSDIQLQQNHSGVRRQRLVARVDLTPMVDLAFLLITFFMLTNELHEEHAMKLLMPVSGTVKNINPDCLLTCILGSDNKIWYYQGNDPHSLTRTNYFADGIRQLIYTKQENVKSQFNNTAQLVCVIKMTNEATYSNMVDILDEMEITNMYSYAIQDLTEEENMALKEQL